ncbi:MAG: autotransporter outer membrane beta-barrel domain-containing protein [Tistlia sp.]|uniref:autotransporter outer membrane beta-barrel domain-containing protein n=1 Tax=Tistlia sp. TaxID=3057121 RepID=UPI0034A21902
MTFGPGSVYEVEVDASGADRLEVGGTAALDGSRSVTGFGTQSAGYEAAVWALETEAAYDLALSDTATLTPLAGLRYTHSSRDAYSETGLAGLSVGSNSEDSLRGRLGAELAFELERATFYTRAAWSHELADPDGTTEATLLGGPSYTLEGQRLPADLAEIGLGLAWAPWDNVDVFAAYEGVFSTGYASHAGQLGVRYSW